jgi:hypothetical protein
MQASKEIPLSARKRVAYASNHAIPSKFFRGGIIYQYAIHAPSDKVAPIIPDLVAANTGHDEEAGFDPFIDDVRRWMLLRQKLAWRIIDTGET